MTLIQDLTNAVCGRNSESTYGIVADPDILAAITDDLEKNEKTLLSGSEIAVYLMKYQEEGLKTLGQLAKMDPQTLGCQPNAPLFEADHRKRILQLLAKTQSNTVVDYDAEVYNFSPILSTSPSSELVEALSKGITFGSLIPGLANKLEHGLSHRAVEGVIFYNEDFFVPAENKSQWKDEVTYETEKYWSDFALIMLQEAWKKAFAVKSMDDLDKSPLLKEIQKEYPQLKIRLSPSVSREVYLYVDVTSGSPEENDKIKAQMETILEKVRARVKTALQGLVSMPQFMKEVMQTVALERQLDIEIVAKELAAYYDRLRARTETYGDKQAFLSTLNGMVKKLAASDKDFADAKVELLTSRDYALGKEGLYKPSSGTIRVPMTYYYCGQKRDLDDVLQILAHELAHHKLHKMRLRQKGPDNSSPHSFIHVKVEETILRRLKTLPLD